MTAPIGGRAAAGAAPVAPKGEHERLRQVARDLEGVFVEQLFKAMRETVPDGGVVDGGTGEEMFTGLLDQKMSALAPAKWERGLAEALYKQLRGRVGADASVEGGTSKVEGADSTGATSGLRPSTFDAPSPAPDFSLHALAPILSTDTRPEHA